MGAQIEKTAAVDPRAELGPNVRIGHFCVVGPDVKIGEGTVIEDHVTIKGHTSIGRDNHIFAGCVIGTHPQDKSYRGTNTRVEIGDGNTFRELCTVNRASEKEDGVTRVGDSNYFMTQSHIAHDCKLGDRIVAANNCMIGGHVHIGNDVTIAGGVGIHHFVSVGQLSFIGAMSTVLHDVPPYMIVEGANARPRCVNVVGLKRNDYPQDDINVLNQAFRLLYRARVGVDAARDELLSIGPIRPVLRHLFDHLEHTGGGRHGRGRDRRKAA
ncbi:MULTISPECIES: acyl-ACP--UDP-N-acetylglucosamine O-acyltransferase [Crateriforma]|uniref:Acyl-[acyl-carrier-protein]--UDP-N-acetylglucosamine O-acyltransferase n=1 Tax=Crateriforma conspicua TaxID=2527996 RepID=A0A5C6FXB1_9PLAN|nr:MULTISPECIES: acyl-ACP--UDP-N-acetylglucosamine O-acyltransferase [Crateriforma]TWU67559.1 Acyl-[acyl-carrier-protein]--UDP-N-acetylglucosamine O-acyltransferase [Crateriforma conspicua]